DRASERYGRWPDHELISQLSSAYAPPADQFPAEHSTSASMNSITASDPSSPPSRQRFASSTKVDRATSSSSVHIATPARRNVGLRTGRRDVVAPSSSTARFI